MLNAVLLAIRLSDIGLATVGNSTLNPALRSLFPESISISDTLVNSSVFRPFQRKQWILLCDAETGIAPFYLLSFLATVAPLRTVIGRFGCIPTPELPPNRPFRRCHRHPITRSGFLFTTDLLNQFQMVSPVLEYSVGLSFQEATFIDDFRFQFLPANSWFRRSTFLASFWPSASSSLPFRFSHASGLQVPVVFTPYLRGMSVLGGTTAIPRGVVETSEFVDVKCGLPNGRTVGSVGVYLRRPVVEIRCFD
jgi:hypothetical protein